VWVLFYRFTPKQLYHWRVFLLKLFGCKVTGRPYVAPSSIIKMPWHLTLKDRACLGPRCNIYNLGEVTLGERATISQEVYVCAGTHDFSLPNLPLVTAPIEIGTDVFVGARAFLMPGVTIGQGALVGAASVVTKNVEPWAIVAGNPAKYIKRREFKDS